MNIALPSSGWKRKPMGKPAQAGGKLSLVSYTPEDSGLHKSCENLT
jgi:hypothetical protein